jgi:N-acetylglucosamine-6-sulfatase
MKYPFQIYIAIAARAALIFSLVFFLSALGSYVPYALADAPARPNFLVIVSDDQRLGSIEEAMPYTATRIFGEGAEFTNGFISTPICCPSRAGILTGRYAKNNGVKQNSSKLLEPTFMQRLKAAGYRTALVGKYLNTHPGTPLPEYDYWVSYKGGKADYRDPILNVNGTWGKHTGYSTEIYRDYVNEFLNDHLAHHSDQPFAVIFTPSAPHSPANPAHEFANAFKNFNFFIPPSFGEKDVSDKPQWVQKRAHKKGLGKIPSVSKLAHRQLETLVSLDLAVADIVTTLSSYKALDTTALFYISDNGLLLGEHYMYGKSVPYEEAVHVPFALRYPPLIPVSYKESRLTMNIDIRPTIEELAGLTPEPTVDGLSLVRLFDNTPEWREAVYIEGWPRGRPHFRAIRTNDHKLIKTAGDITELYDLKNDPYELDNQFKNPAYASIKKTLFHYLQQLEPH